MIVDLTGAHWTFIPAAIGPSVKVIIKADGRRFVATIDDSTLPFLDRFVDAVPTTGPVDLAAEATRLMGGNPFVELPVDPRPWYRKLFGRR